MPKRLSAATIRIPKTFTSCPSRSASSSWPLRSRKCSRAPWPEAEPRARLQYGRFPLCSRPMTKRHSLILLAFPLLLAGCTDTDWDHVLGYSGLEENAAPTDVPQRRPAPNPQPAAVAAEPA